MICRSSSSFSTTMMTFLPSLVPSKRHADEAGVLVAVADDQAAELALQRQAGKQLRFAADLQPEVKRLAGVEDFLHHLAQLVHFDREDAAVFALIIELGDGVAESQVDGLDAVPQDVLKPDQHRKLQPARFGFFDHVGQVHRRAGVPQRLGDDVPGFIDVEVLRAPTMNVIQIPSGLDIPRLVPSVELLISLASNRAHHRTARREFNRRVKNIFAARESPDAARAPAALPPLQPRPLLVSSAHVESFPSGDGPVLRPVVAHARSPGLRTGRQRAASGESPGRSRASPRQWTRAWRRSGWRRRPKRICCWSITGCSGGRRIRGRGSGAELLRCLLEHNIAVYSSHLPLDAASAAWQQRPALRGARLEEPAPVSAQPRPAHWLSSPRRDLPRRTGAPPGARHGRRAADHSRPGRRSAAALAW